MKTVYGEASELLDEPDSFGGSRWSKTLLINIVDS
jgi:hypothetical protein